MRRSPGTVLPARWAAAAVMTMLSLLLSVPAPASADTVTPVDACPSGDRSYSSVDANSITATAPEGYRIESFCVVGRGSGAPELHVLSAPKGTAVIQHSSGRRLESYSVAYARVPAPSAPEAAESAEETAPEKEQAEAEDTASAQESEPEPSRSAPAEKPATPGESTLLPSQMSDGEELQITTFEEKDDSEDRWSFLVVGGIIVVGLLAGAIALLVRIPGQR